MNKARLAVLPLLVFSTVLAVLSPAQETKPVIAVLPFTFSGIAQEEVRPIENLVQSYISETDAFRLTATADRDRVLSEWEFSASDVAKEAAIGKLLSADFLVSGSIGAVGDNRVLTLEIVKVTSGEKRSQSSINGSMSDLALGARDLVLKLLDQGSPAATESATTAEAMDEERIVGTWRGDKGTELVRLYRGGSGIAILSSGIRMDLAYTITGSTLRVVQTSPNTERFYHPVPYSIARQLIALAKPMEWEFQLFAKGTVLRGLKRSTAVRYQGDTIQELSHSREREAEWAKTSR